MPVKLKRSEIDAMFGTLTTLAYSIDSGSYDFVAIPGQSGKSKLILEFICGEKKPGTGPVQPNPFNGKLKKASRKK
jgi:ABC-type ATPase involved in cell division